MSNNDGVLYTFSILISGDILYLSISYNIIKIHIILCQNYIHTFNNNNDSNDNT